MKLAPLVFLVLICILCFTIVKSTAVHKFLITQHLQRSFPSGPPVHFVVDDNTNTNNVSIGILDSDTNTNTNTNPNKDLIPLVQIAADSAPEFWSRLLFDGDVGLGEMYVDQQWTAGPSGLVATLSNLYSHFRTNSGDESVFVRGLSVLGSVKRVVCSSSEKDVERAQHHYDVGNDFYDLFLKPSALKAYTCAFFSHSTTTLDEAQRAKVDLIVRKLGQTPGQSLDKKTILDIGCGWGHIANYVAQQTGARVVGLTAAAEQAKYIRDFGSKTEGSVDVIEADYRTLLDAKYKGAFDHVYTIGFLEAIRYENMTTFFRILDHVLKPGGRAVIHTIVSPVDTPKKSIEGGTFITKHIFPGGQIPMHDWITNAAAHISGLHLAHSEVFGGQHYARTLRVWRETLLKEYYSQENVTIREKYPPELLRKYEYYLASSEAGFSVGLMGLGHFVYVKTGTVGPIGLDEQYFPIENLDFEPTNTEQKE